MKAILSNRTYLEVTPEYGQFLKDELTYKIPSYHDPEKPIIIRNYGIIRPGLMSLPIGRVDLIPKDYTIVDKRITLPMEFPEFQGTLRESQQDVHDGVDDNAIVNAKPSWGKAQPSYSLIRVPEGWCTMGNIKVGDKVITPENKIATVINKYPHKAKPIYEITLIDGRITHACGEHLWEVFVNRDKHTTLLTTEELLNKSRLLKEGRLYLPLTSPIDDCAKEHVINPYLLGLLLGDGGLTAGVIFSTADKELINIIQDLLPEGHYINHISNYDYSITSSVGQPNLILNELRRLGLMGCKSNHKFIHEEYKFDSLLNKLSLIQGLLDSDGCIEDSGKIEFCTTSKKLMDDFCEIIRSLGGSASVTSRITQYTYNNEKKDGICSYRCRPTRIPYEIKKELFRLKRKKEKIRLGKLDNLEKLGIKSIELLKPDDCFCIEIDCPNHLYITDDYIVTHNTFASLAIAGKLAQKTLVVVHTVPLRNQWAREVKKVYGFEPGIIGSSKFNIDSPITVGNVQSLYNCMDRIQKSFGTVILDEMHHVSSPTFSKVIDRSYARYKLGLSGTLKRKDGKDVLFKDYFGQKVFVPPPENSMAPEVDVINSGIEMPAGGAWALRVNALMESPEYRSLILALAEHYTDRGHYNLIVADRVEFLQYCASKRPESVAVVGETEDREAAIESVGSGKNEIWGTTSIFKEGISHNILSCLILGTPINNDPMLEQLVGRVQRIVPGKKTPRVVDIRLSGWTGEKQFQARLGFYMRMGYKINYL